MEGISRFVLMPLMAALLFAAHHEKTRARALGCPAIRAIETRLGALERYYWLFFALCMAAGVLVRVWRFGVLPLGMNQDGTVAGVEAYSLLMTGTDQHGTPWPTYFEAWGYSQMSTLYSYLLIPFIKGMGLSKLTLRLPMLLASLLTLPLIWDFARRLVDKKFALLALFLTAVCPWHIIQSRWALEANLMPHILLLAMELLLIGMGKKRIALYASMIFFGLTPYAYGVACYIVPVILLFGAVYCVARKKITIADLIVCVIVFFATSGLYFATMVINAFGLESVTVGPFTLPYFEQSLRSREMVFMQENPYGIILNYLYEYLNTFFFMTEGAAHSSTAWTHTLYLFMPPALLCGAVWLWHDRRALARAGRETPLRDGAFVVLLWLCSTLVNGLIVLSVINRNNAIYYPALLCCAYALWRMGKRLRVCLAAAVVMIALSFAGLCATYFADEAYQSQVGESFNAGLQEALADTHAWDCDRYYITITGAADREKIMTGQVMFAHRIDSAQRREEIDLNGPDGQPNGWYYTERYVYQDFTDFEPDPTECATYIILQEEKAYFDEADYLIRDYDNYAAVYPRYWAE